MKRTSILVILLILATVPATVAADHTIVWEYQFPAECPSGNLLFQMISGYRSLPDKTFDTATISYFNLTIGTTQPADITVYLAQYGYGYNMSYQQITNRVIGSEGVVTFNASDFGLDEWTGFPENNTWTGYHNLTHYYQTTLYSVRLPYFLIEFFNTGTELADVIWNFEWNMTLHGYRDHEDVTYFSKETDWPDIPPGVADDSTVYHWWGDYWPGTSNILVDGFFRVWLDKQDYNNTEWYAFYYDPTQFYPVIFEYGLVLGVMIGVVGALVLGYFASKRMSV